MLVREAARAAAEATPAAQVVLRGDSTLRSRLARGIRVESGARPKRPVGEAVITTLPPPDASRGPHPMLAGEEATREVHVERAPPHIEGEPIRPIVLPEELDGGVRDDDVEPPNADA